MSESETIKPKTKEELKEIEEKMVVPSKLPKLDGIQFPNEITKLFYMLPLNEEQRKELYEEIMAEYNSNPDSEKLKAQVTL